MASKAQKSEFLKLLNQCRGTLLKLCLLYTDRQPDNINDLFQDIVCNMWEGYPRYAGECTPNTWVYRIALNTVYMRHRVKRRMPQFVKISDTMYDGMADDSGNELVERLYYLIDLLDEEERAIIIPYLDKVSQKEMAVMFDTTETAINHRINRIKKKLKKLNDNEPE